MNKLFLTWLMLVASFFFLANDAAAKRLGGGRSIGMGRETPAVKQAAPAASPTAPTSNTAMPAAAPAPVAAPPAPAAGRNRWLGPIAGLAAGIGLAALLSHFGLGEGVASFLMVLLLIAAAFFVFRLLFRKAVPQPALVGPGSPAPAPMAAPTTFTAPLGPAAANSIPANFDSEGFLRQAKLNFIRLQAANDAGNLDDIKQFTAPEIYAEIQLQLEERDRIKQETDVMQLDAELLELVTEGERYIASVRFHGRIREDASTHDFAEIWHLTKPQLGNQGWVVAGIQQIQ